MGPGVDRAGGKPKLEDRRRDGDFARGHGRPARRGGQVRKPRSFRRPLPAIPAARSRATPAARFATRAAPRTWSRRSSSRLCAASARSTARPASSPGSIASRTTPAWTTSRRRKGRGGPLRRPRASSGRGDPPLPPVAVEPRRAHAEGELQQPAAGAHRPARVAGRDPGVARARGTDVRRDRGADGHLAVRGREHAVPGAARAARPSTARSPPASAAAACGP